LKEGIKMRGSRNPIAKAMFESKLFREKGVGNPYFEPYNRRDEADDIEKGLREIDEDELFDD
jgi:hypothetical protein